MHFKTFGWIAALVLLAGSLLSPSAAQISGVPSPGVIRVRSNLVTVPVSVTDTTGKPNKELKSEDFRIEENGRPEPLAKMAEPGITPLNLVLLFDNSGSLNPRFQFELEAATRFLKKLIRPTDTVGVVAIGENPDVVHPLAPSVDRALESLRMLTPTRSMTAFFDSVIVAARLTRQSAGPEARRVGVALSDGEDNNSRHDMQDASRELQRADCLFYSINPGGESIRLNTISIKGQRAMTALAAETGGTAFLPKGPEELDAIFDRIGTELQAQYLLEYYSSDQRTDGAFRKITVRVPARSDLRIRARQGYYAPSE
jgi:VWFA-related protein